MAQQVCGLQHHLCDRDCGGEQAGKFHFRLAEQSQNCYYFQMHPHLRPAQRCRCGCMLHEGLSTAHSNTAAYSPHTTHSSELAHRKGSVRRCGVAVLVYFWLVFACRWAPAPALKEHIASLVQRSAPLIYNVTFTRSPTPRKPNNTGRKEMEGLDGHQF